MIETIVVQDFLVVALGDSFGSGQGNPDKPIPPRFSNMPGRPTNSTPPVSRIWKAVKDAYDEVVRKTQLASDRNVEYTAALLHMADVCTP